jgi:hypothetical protein
MAMCRSGLLPHLNAKSGIGSCGVRKPWMVRAAGQVCLLLLRTIGGANANLGGANADDENAGGNASKARPIQAPENNDGKRSGLRFEP